MSVVLVVEETIRDLFNPDKINLASLEMLFHIYIGTLFHAG